MAWKEIPVHYDRVVKTHLSDSAWTAGVFLPYVLAGGLALCVHGDDPSDGFNLWTEALEEEWGG